MRVYDVLYSILSRKMKDIGSKNEKDNAKEDIVYQTVLIDHSTLKG